MFMPRLILYNTKEGDLEVFPHASSVWDLTVYCQSKEPM